ncbi:RluA family pseudouridine synthase [bacterium]|nr:RluA family pseudouridine synthase [bacterium]
MKEKYHSCNRCNISYYSAMTYSEVNIIAVDADYEGQRIDNFLLARLKGVPKSRIYRLLRKGEVRVNKKRIKPTYKLLAGDQVRIPPVRTATVKVGQLTPNLEKLLASSVLYEDADLMVLNKPAGLAVHGGSGVSLGLIEALRQWKGSSVLELAHRLDRDTSGCIIVAKKRSMLRFLQQGFREGAINKVYHALVVGEWPKRLKKINKPLLKNAKASDGRTVSVAMIDMVGAKPSVTHFSILESFKHATLVEARPVTGRTHQIRVHCQSAGCSIVGDDKYTTSEINKQFRERGAKRLFLHALNVSFNLPDGRLMSVSAPVGDEWLRSVKQLKCL